MVGVGRDISDRRERERELRTYQEAVEDAGHAVFWTDTEGVIEYVNPAFEEQTGYSDQEAVGETPAILKSGVHSEEFYEDLWGTIKDGDVWEDEVINRRKNGERYIVSQSISPVYQDGEIDRFVAISAEITESYHRTQQLSVLQRVLRHDLRNNLNEVILSAQLLGREIEDDELMDRIDAIKKTVEETLSLADRARDLRKIFEHSEGDHNIDVDICERIEKQVSAMRTEYPEVEFEIDIPAQQVFVVTNELIDQAIRNVIQNAVQHNDAEVTEIEIDMEVKNEEVVLSIADNGPGIPEEEVEALNRDREGQLKHLSGLGLWLVNWILTLSGGSLEFEKNQPRGTVAKLVLPTSEDST